MGIGLELTVDEDEYADPYLVPCMVVVILDALVVLAADEEPIIPAYEEDVDVEPGILVVLVVVEEDDEDIGNEVDPLEEYSV